MAESTQDKWARWLLNRRYGGQPDRRQEVLDFLLPIRERILDNAQLSDRDTVLDVGTGDGLIAFGALDRLGTSGRVILNDISQELVDHSRSLAEEMDVLDRCQFICASAEDLTEIKDGSVDVVTTRSVLIYLPAEKKQQALREFHRVLRRRGRLSIFEPINRFTYPEPHHLFSGYDVSAVRDLADRVRAVAEQANPPETHPLLDFDERDLLRWVEQAAFEEIHMDYGVEIAPGAWFHDWDAFLKTAGNPLDLTVEETVNQALTREEASRFLDHLRPLVEAERGIKRWAFVYLWAVKL